MYMCVCFAFSFRYCKVVPSKYFKVNCRSLTRPFLFQTKISPRIFCSKILHPERKEDVMKESVFILYHISHARR